MILLARSRAVHIVLLISLLSTIQPFMISKLESPSQYKVSRSNRYLPRFQERLVDDSITTDTESRNQDKSLASNSIVQTSALMFLLSAPLGMMLDNFHGLFGVLEYNAIGKPIEIMLGGHAILKTALWVPFLFGFAGFLMSGIVLVADNVLDSRKETMSPSWQKVQLGISLFIGQYFLSGLLSHAELESSFISILLQSIAFCGYIVLDLSFAGIFLAYATAIGGPLIEIYLINYPHLYQYTTSDLVYGIPIWITHVYFLGAPAVANLARRINSDKKMR